MSTAKFNQWLNPDGTENYKCRAWCAFNAISGTPVILSSGNISSITDNAVGDFTLNFISALPDANYALSGMGEGNPSYWGTSVVIQASPAGTPVIKTAAAVRIRVDDGVALRDSFTSVAIFR